MVGKNYYYLLKHIRYDKINPNELASKVASECFDVQNAIGEKVGSLLMNIGQFVAAFIIAYTRGWSLALVCTAALPAITISTAVFMYIVVMI